MEENQDKKYYYDEYTDRKDSYRKHLVGLITKGSQEIRKGISEDFCNDVLSVILVPYFIIRLKIKKV